MQNKGAIRFFAIALAIVCVFQLSFTLITYRVEKKAKEYAQTLYTKKQASLTAASITNKDSVIEAYEKRYLDSLGTVPVFNVLVKNYTYKECKEKEINLGLDLRGGMNVTLEVSVVDLIRSMSNYSTDSTFNRAISKAVASQKNSQKDFVTLFAESFKAVDPNAKLAAVFNTLELKDKINYQSTNEQVIEVIRKEANDAIDRSFNILRTRIDKFGVTQPNIQKLDVSGRILVELPGVKDKQRVRKLLQGTANLEFWETYENAEIVQKLIDVDTKLGDLYAGKKDDVDTSAAVTDSSAVKGDSLTSKTEVRYRSIGSSKS